MMSEEIQKYRILSAFLPKADRRRVVILTGARQTGKTTLVKFFYPQLRYFNLDAPEIRESVRELPAQEWARAVGNAVIDEAQKEPLVFEKLKYAYDEKGVSFSVLLGSSQILLLKKIRESLAGRVSMYELWPLMMSEIAFGGYGSHPESPLVERLLSQANVSSVLSKEPQVLLDKEQAKGQAAENYLLQWGGMPALLYLSDEERWKWLKDYEYTYLERDLGDLARLDDLMPFRKFQKLSALRSGRLLHYSEIARDASVSVDTARRYLEYLRLSYQVILMQPYQKNLTSSVVKTPKLYWGDIGLLRQLSGFRGELTGEIYETFVVNELYKWIKTAQKDTGLYFYRTRSGLELDILLEAESGIMGIEIKARAAVANKDLRSLREVARAVKKKWIGGIVVYRGNNIRKIGEPHLWAVPSYRLFT